MHPKSVKENANFSHQLDRKVFYKIFANPNCLLNNRAQVSM